MKVIPVSHAGQGLRIAIVVARFNEAVGEGLLQACVATLKSHGVAEEHLLVVRVPGALEIPLALQHLARTGSYQAMVALGCVVRGETYHFELVADQSAAGITQVQLDFGIPIANGVLTTENDDQAHARMAQKGLDCALAALEMANLPGALKRHHA